MPDWREGKEKREISHDEISLKSRGREHSHLSNFLYARWLVGQLRI